MHIGWKQTDYQKRLKHAHRMDTDRLVKQATTCSENGNKSLPKEAKT